MPLNDCLAWLRSTLRIDEHFLAQALTHRHQTDVNGRPLGGGLVTVNAQLPGKTDAFVILLHLRPDDTVRQADSNLLYGLVEAVTEPVYDRSGLYEIVWRLIGRRCPGIEIALRKVRPDRCELRRVRLHALQVVLAHCFARQSF